MHPMTRAVVVESRRLEFEQFREPADRHRLNEIRALAVDQVTDDVGAVKRDRVGREYVFHYQVGEEYDGEQLWRRKTPDAIAIEDALMPFLQRLSNQQREVIHLRHWGRLSEYQTAAVLNITRPTVQVHERRALAHLGTALKEEFVGNDA